MTLTQYEERFHFDYWLKIVNYTQDLRVRRRESIDTVRLSRGKIKGISSLFW